MASGAYVIREDGARNSSVSRDCPRCGHLRINAESGKSPDFSEEGWFYTASFECLNAKCQHKWREKIVVQTGGFRL